MNRRYSHPRATYRLQLDREFTFSAAARVVPYLHEMGITHLYLSPIFLARPGSAHGYDVIDHNQVNPEIGGIAGLYELSEALLQHEMGLIVDIVPNHVGVGSENPWWRDVLRYGQASRFAPYFDIDWEGQPQMASGVLVVPVLGKVFGRALEDGELQLDLDHGEIVVRYYEHVLPIAPRSYPELLGLLPPELSAEMRDPTAFSTLVDLLDELRRADTERSSVLLERWMELVASEPALEQHLRGVLAEVNGQPGEPASFDRLERLLRDQHYRLANWRVSGEELNYRRFFDVNDLAGIRVEREDVFEDVHRLLFQLVEAGIVTGVRVDHVDGLYNPAEYLERLATRLAEAARSHTSEPLPIYVEKILEGDEELDPRWPVAGTTGYEFMARVDALLVNRAGRAPLDALYRRIVGPTLRFDRAAYRARVQVADTSFAGEINVLALQLHRIAQGHRLYRDNTLRALHGAIRSVLASFPVYRTYVTSSLSEESTRYLREALHSARQNDRTLSEDALGLLERVLLLQDDTEPDEHARRMHFRRRFQQLSGPIMAKGVEDTLLYRYNRLISLNEVGGEPQRFGRPPADIHAWFEARAKRWPLAMSGSSTHDTKRSEDVRARLHVLSEIPDEWEREVRAWFRLNERHRGEASGDIAPSNNLEYYLYQTLVGTWEGQPSEAYRERMRTHLTKAMREAKVETSWTQVNEAYEATALAFLDRILNRRSASAFLRRLDGFVQRIAPSGALNARTALVLKVLAPGFPDFYQGTECEALTVTDPDNRRPVDFDALAGQLAALGANGSQPPLLSGDGKLWLTRRLMEIRAEFEDLLCAGSYAPMAVQGDESGRVFAFARELRDRRVVVAVPRLAGRLVDANGSFGDGAWQGMSIAIGQGRWHDRLTGTTFEAQGEGVALSAVFERMPLVVLTEERV